MIRRATAMMVSAMIALPGVASAFQVGAMRLTFGPAGPEATRTLTIENPTGARTAVQFEALERGSDRKAPFRITPEQTALRPGEKRDVRVEWIGPAKPDARAYRLLATELPVFAEKGRKPKFLLQYVISATVNE